MRIVWEGSVDRTGGESRDGATAGDLELATHLCDLGLMLKVVTVPACSAIAWRLICGSEREEEKGLRSPVAGKT